MKFLGRYGRRLGGLCRAAVGAKHHSQQKTLLFLGNSHLSALKLAYDDARSVTGHDFRFFCARGADLAFTEVSDGKIKPRKTTDLSDEQLSCFYGPYEAPPTRYTSEKLPLDDVAEQFLATGGAPQVDLADVAAIFYVAGMSPYDFQRLGRNSLFLKHAQRYECLNDVLGKHFFLNRQISAIRNAFPACKHYFIGRPLAASFHGRALCGHVDDVIKARRASRALDRMFLFDDVFMPDEESLEISLLATKRKFCIGGCQESHVFQNAAPGTATDEFHMNAFYGQVVLREFVRPLVERLAVP